MLQYWIDWFTKSGETATFEEENSTLCNAEPSFAVLGRGRCFSNKPGVFDITLANRGIFGVGIFTVLGLQNS